MRVRSDDAEIDVTAAGSGDAIVLLAGFPLTREIWEAQAAELARTHLVIRPDLRGIGSSSVPDGPYLMETLAGDIAAVLDALGIDRAAIVGHSLGGYVALAFCRMYSERALKLALVCSRLAADSAEKAREREMLADRAEELGSIDPVMDAYVPNLFAKRTAQQHPELTGRARQIASGIDPRGAAAMLRGMAQRVDSSDIAEDLEMPVLIVAGEEDVIVPVSEAEEMARTFPGAALRVISGSGHMPMMENPSALSEVLAGFAGTGL
jgi:pimeloyl-ACP methyl ester carboxylesterase